MKQGNALQLFKILIQFYLFCFFFCSLTYSNKEVIKGNIFWRLNKKCWYMRQLQTETGESFAIKKNTNSI